MGRSVTQRWTRRFTALTLAVSTVTGSPPVSRSYAAVFSHTPQQSCAGCVDGSCTARSSTYGYYRSSWRRWPGASSGLPSKMAPPEGVPDVQLPDKREETLTRPRTRSNEPLESDLDFGGKPVVPPSTTETTPEQGAAESLPIPGMPPGTGPETGLPDTGVIPPATDEGGGFDFGPLDGTEPGTGTAAPGPAESEPFPALPPSTIPGLESPGTTPPADENREDSPLNFDELFPDNSSASPARSRIRVARRQAAARPTLPLGSPTNRDANSKALPRSTTNSDSPPESPATALPGEFREIQSSGQNAPSSRLMPASPIAPAVQPTGFAQPAVLPTDLLPAYPGDEASAVPRNPLRRSPKFRTPTATVATTSHTAQVTRDEPQVSETLEAFASIDPIQAFAARDERPERSVPAVGDLEAAEIRGNNFSPRRRGQVGERENPLRR